MTHPTDLLADLVDGTIAERDRAGVDAHLASCGRCRAEVAQARAARAALRGLEVPELPAGITDAAIAEAERIARAAAPEVAPIRRPGVGRGGGDGVPAWYRWAAAAAASAAIVLVAVLVLPNVGGSGANDTMGAESGTDRTAATAGGVGALEIQDADYDVALVQALATSYRPSAAAEVSPVVGSPATDQVPELPSGREAPAGTEDALACLRTAFADPSLEPVRLIQARFEGTPAYLGVVLVGPGAGQPADRVQVLVASRDGCTILTTAQALL